MLGWLKELVSGVPSAERAERWRIEDEAKARSGKSLAKPERRTVITSGSHGHDEDLEGDVNRTTRLRFEYVDRDGVCSVREVTDWVETRFYVKGTCTTRQVLRTFRKDQVERWLSGQEALAHGTLPFGRSRY